MSIEQFIASLAASDLSLQGKLDALRTEFETNVAPLPVVAALHRATEELIAVVRPTARSKRASWRRRSRFRIPRASLSLRPRCWHAAPL